MFTAYHNYSNRTSFLIIEITSPFRSPIYAKYCRTRYRYDIFSLLKAMSLQKTITVTKSRRRMRKDLKFILQEKLINMINVHGASYKPKHLFYLLKSFHRLSRWFISKRTRDMIFFRFQADQPWHFIQFTIKSRWRMLTERFFLSCK